MREDEILAKLIDILDTETANDVSVQTAGLDAVDNDAALPAIIIDWRATRIPDAPGHNSRGGVTTDNNGDKDGHEHHSYWSFEADCLLRYQDEVERDKVAHNIQQAFMPYETSPENFNKDTTEWEIGSSGPRNNSVVEPDWYQSGVLITFDYVKRSTEDADVIDTVNTTYDVDENIDAVDTTLSQ